MWPFHRKLVGPEPPIRIIAGLEGFNGRDNYSAIPIRLTEPIEVHHTIERKPLEKPFGATVFFLMPDGNRITYHLVVDYNWITPPIHIPEGCQDIQIEWQRKK